VSVTLLWVKRSHIMEALLITSHRDVQVSAELFKQSENKVERKLVSSDCVSCCLAPLMTGFTPPKTAALTAPLRAPIHSSVKANVLSVGVTRKGSEQ